MSRFSDETLAMIAILLDEDEQENSDVEEERRTRTWVRDAWKTRAEEGEFAISYKLLLDDERKFFEYFRMSRNTFEILLNKLEGSLKKEDTPWRAAITAKERLAVCLKFLATGDSFRAISLSYRLGHSTVQKIVNETCKAIVNELFKEYIPMPSKERWREISKEFEDKWNFPHCIGAIGGKRVTIQAPANSGTQNFNYKRNFSIVLLAIVDAHNNFITVDIGSFGKTGNGGIFSQSNVGKALERNALRIPDSTTLPSSTKSAPFVIVGDEAFPLKTYLMRPYPEQQSENKNKRIFNQRLNRARKVVENAFGILTQKFRLYSRRLQSKPENVDNIILSTCILHNFIKQHEGNTHGGSQMDAASSNNNVVNDLPAQGGNSTSSAFNVRHVYTQYFNEEGAVSWQEDNI